MGVAVTCGHGHRAARANPQARGARSTATRARVRVRTQCFVCRTGGLDTSWSASDPSQSPSSSLPPVRTQATLIEHELTLALDHTAAKPQNNSGYIGVRPSRLSKAFPVPPVVELHPDEGSQNWRLDLIATDRPGLLGDIAQVFVSNAIDLQTAKVMTLGDRVDDVFVIRGEVLNHPRTQRQFERSVLDAITQESSHVS